ncbi:MAG: PepSY-associated TM helix domain-containing protein [Solimonas sp.]
MKVRSDILRVYLTLHTWVGITTGLLLFIGFFAGALTMFKQPLDGWANAPSQRLAFTPDLDTLVAQTLQSQPTARHEFTLHLTQDAHIAAPLVWSAGEGGHELDLSGARRLATLDANGELRIAEQTPSLLGELIDMLHRTGGIPGFVADEYLGIYVLGVAGLLYFVALVSGVIVLLPTLLQDFFALRPGKNRKRFWLDAHNVIGITSLPFHIVISLTVVVFAFHDQFYGALAKVVYREQAMFTPPPAAAQPYAIDALLPPSQLVQRVEQAAPGFTVTELLYRNLESKRPFVRAGIVDARHVLHGPRTAYVGIQPYTGAIVMTSMLPGQADRWSAIVSNFFALHFGSYGGNAVRWIYFLLGIGGAFLFYTGNLLWIESRRKRAKARQPLPAQSRTTQAMAALTIGVCFGSMLGVAAALVGAKVLHGRLANINDGYLALYYGAFGLSLAYAFMRGAARATPVLLASCALACAAIPLSSLLALLLPSLGWWAHGGRAALAVDAGGLAAALLFAYAAYAARRRALHGPVDSVWSVHGAAPAATPATELKA